MDQEKKTLSFVLLLLCVIVGLSIAYQYIVINDLYVINAGITVRLAKIMQKAILFRFLYIILVAASAFLFPRQKRRDDKKWMYTMLALVFAAALFAGFTRESYFYNLYVFPFVFIGYTICAVYAIPYFMPGNMQSDKDIFGVSDQSSDFYFVLQTDNGQLTVHKPQQNIYIDGGPGSGKSESWIKGMIYQCAERNYSGLIYDWEGDPMKKNSPILSQVAYGSIEHFRKKGKTTPAFAFINFTDMKRTVRVNVFSEKYVPRGNESLFIRNIVITLMKNLEPSWKERTDFWANNAINYVYSVAYKCYKQRNSGINTLAHVIAFCLSDSDLVFKWLSEDPEIALNMSSMLTAWRLGAQQQTAGAVSSAQTPLVLLNNKYIFWVLSPLPEEEFSLDITNPEHPTLLCVGNAPSIKETISPPISCICSVVMSCMNTPGQVTSVFMVDEFPTVNLQGIDTFIGTARKHNVATILAVQDFNQAVRDYGEKSANILKASCGTQAFGMTGNDKTAKDVESLFGEKKEIQESFSKQSYGSDSRTESLQKEKVMKARDVAGQRAGHFIGKVANGNPPFFNTQFHVCEYVSGAIPVFSLPVTTGKPDLDEEILESIIDNNYKAVIQKVNDILRNFATGKT
ncbi:MAG: type IV secretion system DNA-binding domain-containing protein [Dysgonamonadaceae bacterium]|jgi:hypothetical protein|nr:type IV secretion system DNA-binding domain-containing protein [Dysgonamonadaceae bacterium]